MSTAMEAMTAMGTFEVKPDEEHAYHEVTGQPRLTHAGGTQRFSGDLDGQGSIEWLMCYLPDRSATFVGLQRIDGSIDGRSGTFVMNAYGNHDGTGSDGTWTVVPGSGTGGLVGIAGEGSFHAAGGPTVIYVLEFRFD